MQIEDLIIESLKAFIELPFIGDTENTTSSKLVFPNKRDNQIRICEQEARLLFIKQVEINSSFHYSVETPTAAKYRFSGKAKRSGNIDVCLFENGHRKHLIEFKAHNKECLFKKDFIKLIGDENGLQNYFIHVLASTNSRTFDSIEKKYRQALADAFNETIPKTNLLTIFVCDRKHRTIYRYVTNGKDLGLKQQI